MLAFFKTETNPDRQTYTNTESSFQKEGKEWEERGGEEREEAGREGRAENRGRRERLFGVREILGDS